MNLPVASHGVSKWNPEFEKPMVSRALPSGGNPRPKGRGIVELMLNLTPFAISGFFIVITYLPLSILIFLRGKTKLTKIYALHIFAIIWWGVGSFLMGINTNSTIAPMIWKFAYLGVLFIPVFFFMRF